MTNLRQLTYYCHRGTSLIRGWLLSCYLRYIHSVKVGKNLVCYGWPRSVLNLGTIEIGDKVSIGRSVLFATGKNGRIHIGDDSTIGDYCTMHAEQTVELGSNCLVAEFVSIRDFDHGFSDPVIIMQKQPMTAASVYIGSNVWLARGVAVLKGATIESQVVIGANAVVPGKTYASGSVAVGIPAKTIKTIAPVAGRETSNLKSHIAI